MKITLEQLKLSREEIEFVQPAKCECGCGNDVSLVAETQEELVEAMCSILNEFDCEHCMGIAFRELGDVIIADKLSRGIYGTDQFNCIRTIKDIVEHGEIGHMVVLIQSGEDTYDFIY